MAQVNGPYFIEQFSYRRDAQDQEQGILIMTAAGGEEFGAPMSVSQLKSLIEKLKNDLEST